MEGSEWRGRGKGRVLADAVTLGRLDGAGSPGLEAVEAAVAPGQAGVPLPRVSRPPGAHQSPNPSPSGSQPGLAWNNPKSIINLNQILANLSRRPIMKLHSPPK